MRSHSQLECNSSPAFAPASGGLLHRKCACGGSAGLAGDCAQCRRNRLVGHAEVVSGHAPLSSVGAHFLSGKSDCAPDWYGDTAPEMDAAGESFTGNLIVKYNDAAIKSPCVRECVEQHEAVHVAHLTPIVKKIAECDRKAGQDWDKKGKCNELATELTRIRAASECEAYRKSFTCLTLKVLDSSSPCSKPPHRDEVQKHRGYDGCGMKKECSAAGTPERGVPNV